ncbi:MAG: hypothetical protein ACOYJ1_09195 [Peptococcales bacterium]|jgi:hypothetical protein
MKSKTTWRNKSSLREKYSLMNLLGKTPMEVADPIFYSYNFPEASEKSPEQKK